MWLLLRTFYSAITFFKLPKYKENKLMLSEKTWYFKQTLLRNA